MAHKECSGPHSFENTGDQSWNNMPAEQVDVQLAREHNVQNRALVYPVENINQEAVRLNATWTAPGSTGFIPFGRSDGFQHHQPNISALSEDPFIHQSSVGSFKSVPESFDSHASSSNYVCHTFYDANIAFTEPNIDAHIQSLKRKDPMIPSAYEAGSCSRYYFSGSSSNFSVASEICHEKTRNDSMQMPCHCFCTDDCYNCNGLKAKSVGSLRNIRSRTKVDPNYNDARVPVPTNASHSTFYTTDAIKHCSMVNHQGQNSNALTRQWNNNMISHDHGRALTPGSRVCHERYRSFHEPEGVHPHQLDYKGLMATDRSTFYASRNMYDQHRDLRLDIDSMSYERFLDQLPVDLLTLGDRIGSVSTGLSEDAMKKCLIESLYCSYDQLQDDSRCVICLEEYGNTDKIGKLKACGHDCHVNCIRKWLSMKNICPICNAPALEEEVVKQK